MESPTDVPVRANRRPVGVVSPQFPAALRPFAVTATGSSWLARTEVAVRFGNGTWERRTMLRPLASAPACAEGLAVGALGTELPPQAGARSSAASTARRAVIMAILSGHGRAQALEGGGEHAPVEGLGDASTEERGLFAEVVAVGEHEE